MRLFSKLCAFVTLMIGCLILVGNIMGIELLIAPVSNMAPARFNSGICVILSGIVLIITNTFRKKILHSVVYNICSLLILLLSLYALIHYFPAHDQSLDPIKNSPGGMSFFSSIIFSLLSLSFLFNGKKRKNIAFIPLFVMNMVFFFALFIIFTHVFRASIPIGWYTYSSIAIYTDIAFLFISAGFITTYPEYKIVRLYASKGTCGFILRSILLPLFIILPAFSYLRILGEEHSYFNTGFGSALMTIVILILFTVIITNVCYMLDKKENELVKSEKIFSSLVQSVKDYAIFLLDSNGYVASWNDGAQRLKGYTKDEIIGKHYSVFYTKEEQALNEPEQNLKIAAEKGHLETEGWRVRKDGIEFLADIVISPVYDTEDTLTGFVKIVRDVTARRKATEEKNKLILLQQKHKELENFTYILSHDVLAPLRNISMLSKWLTEDYAEKLDEEGKGYLVLMNEKISLLGAMIDEVLVYIRAGKTASERTELDSAALVKDIVKLQSIPEKANIIIDTTLPTVIASKTALKQVFTNLVDNAIKHNDKEEAIVHIGCESADNHWKFYVKDNGPGIPAENYEKVFQLFGGGSPEKGVKSHGIGLATVKRSIEGEGGKVWIDAEIGKGSTFFFTLKKKEDA